MNARFYLVFLLSGLGLYLFSSPLNPEIALLRKGFAKEALESFFSPLPPQPPIPKENPQNPEKIALGKKLYFDKRLSKDSSISCNSCHRIDNQGSGSDGLSTSTGIGGQKGSRRAPTVWNAALQMVQFWDGRAASLEAQAKGPIINPGEMGMESHEALVLRLKTITEYPSAFKKAFAEDTITIERVAQAIASYERTLITPNSPFDRYLAGDKKAISELAKKGAERVRTLGCLACHQGPMLAGPPVASGFFMKFPVYAGSEYEKKYMLTEDKGREQITKKPEDRNLWRVASWRNVAIRAPYFHNGLVPSLEEAVRVMAKTQLNKSLSQEEVRGIVAFLESLTGERPVENSPF